jgi:hypothetical protein
VKGRVERHSNPLLNQPVGVLPIVVCSLTHHWSQTAASPLETPDRLDFAEMLRFIG